MSLPEKSQPVQQPQNQAPPSAARQPTLTQPDNNVRAKRELEYRQRVTYLKQLFPQLETMPDWELDAIYHRVEMIIAQREEAEAMREGMDIVEEEDADDSE